MRKLEAVILFVISTLGSVHCYATQTPLKASNTREYHEAFAAFEADDLGKAYKILVPLVAKIPAYDAIGLLGQTELALGKYRDAAEHLSFALRNIPAEKANSVSLFLEDFTSAKAKVATLKITVDQHDAEISVDGTVIGKSPIDYDVFTEPGKRTIKATHSTLGTNELTVEVKAGEDRVVTLKLEKPSNTASSAPAPEPLPTLKYTPADLDKHSKTTVNPPPVVEKHSGLETKTIVLLSGTALTLIAAGTGTYFGLSSRSTRKDSENLVRQADTQFGSNACASAAGANSSLCADIASKNVDRRDASRIANVSFAVAGVAAVATGLTYILWPRSKTPTSAFAMVPIATSNSGGLSLQGDF